MILAVLGMFLGALWAPFGAFWAHCWDPWSSFWRPGKPFGVLRASILRVPGCRMDARVQFGTNFVECSKTIEKPTFFNGFLVFLGSEGSLFEAWEASVASFLRIWGSFGPPGATFGAPGSTFGAPGITFGAPGGHFWSS